MRLIGDRLLIFISCLMLAGFSLGISIKTVIALLFAFVIGCIGIYTDSLKIKQAQLLAFGLVSVFLNETAGFIPVFVYETADIIYKGQILRNQIKAESDNGYAYKNEISGQNIQWAVLGISFLLCMYSLYTEFNRTGILFLAGVVCISVSAVWMNICSNISRTLNKKFIETRDNSMELNLALRNKNRYLIEKQDSEIHLATLRERNRIAREIHDNVGHMLSRSILQTGAAITVNNNEDVAEMLYGIKDTLDQAMTSIRNSVHDLHDEAIDIREAVNEITKDLTDFKIKFDYDMKDDVPRNVKYCIISVVKEAVSNIIRHSNGNQVDIEIVEHPAFFKVCIEDNGTSCGNRNIMKCTDEIEGIGLSNIKERIETLKGTLSINTETGFRIFISIPK